jgi:hypothetical protein
MKPGEAVCTSVEGRELVSFDPDLPPIPRHDLALIVTGICTFCHEFDEDKLDEWLRR